MNQVAKIEDRQENLPATPITMLSAALDKGLPPETLERFMDLHKRWEENEARKAYMEAIAAFKRNPPRVVKDAINKQYGSKYTTLGNMVNTVNEALGEHGLHAHWDFEQSDSNIKVTCILTHALGYSERATLAGPPDTSGSKNPIQQIKSTTTYLKGATFEAVTGIASSDGNLDDDGNGADALISADDAAWIKSELQATNSNVVKFCETLKIANVDSMPASKLAQAKALLQRKRRATK